MTNRGEIQTPVVVDAAGGWARLVADMTGIRVPIVPTRHQLYITRPIAGVTSEQAIVRVLDVNVYVRPERDGLMLGGYEPDPLQVDMPRAARHVPNRRPGPRLRAAVPPDRGGAPRVSGAAAEIDQFRGGLPTMTADGRHIIDRVPGLQGFFVASGCCVGALSISPAVGEVLADWMVDGQPPLDLSALGLTRVGPELQSDERLRDACLWRYAHHYVHAPA